MITKTHAPIHLSVHATERLSRLYGLEADSVIRDIKRHLYAARKERGGNKIMVIGDIAKYILTDKLEVITILYRDSKKKNKTREVYYGEQWLNMDRFEVRELIRSLIT